MTILKKGRRVARFARMAGLDALKATLVLAIGIVGAVAIFAAVGGVLYGISWLIGALQGKSAEAGFPYVLVVLASLTLLLILGEPLVAAKRAIRRRWEESERVSFIGGAAVEEDRRGPRSAR